MLIYGAGVIGSVIAGKLAISGQCVTVLARGQRLEEIKRNGIELSAPDTGRKEFAKVNVINKLMPEEVYDYIFVVMQRTQVDEVLPILAENKSKNIIFIVNTSAGYGEWAQAVGSERLMLAFPSAGGERLDGEVRYFIGKGFMRIFQTTTFGEYNGKKTGRSHGLLVWSFANGIDDSEVTLNSNIIQKGVGNSTTVPYDVTTRDEACKVLLALTERVAMRLRRLGYMASLMSVSVKNDSFFHYSHQLQLHNTINTTDEIYNFACLLFDQCWKGEPVRHLGVSVSDFSPADIRQMSIFDKRDMLKVQKLDKTVDKIREKYGTRSIIRGSFVNGNVNPVQGGTNDSDFIMMGGYSQN